MRVRLNLMLWIVLGLVLAGCAQQEQTLPTLVPEVTEQITEEVATEPPTNTPINLERATLPPTWTPSPAPEDAADGGATPMPEIQLLEEGEGAPTPLEVCATFGEDRTLNSRTFTLGAPVQVHWTSVPGAFSYSITLINDAGEEVTTAYATQTTHVFDPSLFEAGRIYGWEAYPIDGAGRQMCFSRGAELFPDNMPGLSQ